jgi:CheY-like chemotaxis protein
LAGKDILVVEDESLIAMLLEMALQDDGCRVVGPASRVPEALDLVQNQSLDGALLDVNLAGESVLPVAEALAARGIPFLLLSGYGDQALPDGRDWPIRSKPFEVGDVLQALAELVAQRVGAGSSGL